MNNLRTQKCARCSQLFTTSAPTALYCSIRCKEAASVARRRARDKGAQRGALAPSPNWDKLKLSLQNG